MKINQTTNQLLKTSILYFENSINKRNKNKNVLLRNKSLNSKKESINVSQFNNRNKMLIDLKSLSFYQTKSKYLNLYNMNKNLSFNNCYSRNLNEYKKKKLISKKYKITIKNKFMKVLIKNNK